MNHDTSTYRALGVFTLQSLVGYPGKECWPSEVPVAIETAVVNLMVAAGDHQKPLDPGSLPELSQRTGRDVIGIWIDPFVYDHPFVIDVVRAGSPAPQVHARYRLWMSERGARLLVPGHGDGVMFAFCARGLEPVTPPFDTEADRLMGIARGQAYLHASIIEPDEQRF